ncbi:MAG: CDGSH iron-sulfur domain-containing protein, partial [Gammaproteobacteria bacterium]|nr:CDGSH iron-sulfur domain-containing protein [Gammaproteobacteria bacterium]
MDIKNTENIADQNKKPVYSGNSIMVRPNGPLICKGDSDITLQDEDARIIAKDKEFALCRCGLSKNKPFCDGSHKTMKEDMPQLFNDAREEDISGYDGDLVITVK